LKRNWINTHNIVILTQNLIVTLSVQDLIVIRSANKQEESKHLLGFEKVYVELEPNVNNNLDAPSSQP
jgi:hypothetical protein